MFTTTELKGNSFTRKTRDIDCDLCGLDKSQITSQNDHSQEIQLEFIKERAMCDVMTFMCLEVETHGSRWRGDEDQQR